jgi:hypothetical protein
MKINVFHWNVRIRLNWRHCRCFHTQQRDFTATSAEKQKMKEAAFVELAKI